MFRILTLLFMLSFGNVIQAQGWDVQVLDPNMWIRDVHTFSANEAIVIGQVDTTYYILRTSNGWASWDTVLTKNNGKFEELQFINARIGWLRGYSLDQWGEPYMRTWRTADGGETWNYFSIPSTGFTRKLSMTGEGKGWMSGLYHCYLCLFEGKLFKLNPGASAWQEYSNPQIDQLYLDSMRDIFFLNDSQGWLVADGYQDNFKTNDGGLSWETFTLPSQILYPLITFIDDQHGWIISHVNFGLWRSSDGGQNWYDTNTSGTILDLQFFDPDTGWAVGTAGLLRKTNDGGLTWAEYPLTTEDIYAVSFANSNVGYAVGSRGVILTTVNGGATGIEDQIDNFLPENISLLPNYPNPFNPSTTLRFELQRRSQVILQITDVAGRHVRTLVNEARSAGLHEVKWDGRDDAGNPVASGVYISRLESRGAVQSQKMLLIR